MTWEIFQPEENRQPYTPTGISVDTYKRVLIEIPPKKETLIYGNIPPRKIKCHLKRR